MIGMPVKNDLECVRSAIQNLINSTDMPFKMVLIEGDSTDGTDKFVDFLAEKYRFIETIHMGGGPLKAYNKLFELAKERKMDLYLTQSDVIHFRLHGRDWLREMHDIAQKPEVGAVTSLNGGGTSGPSYINKFKWIGGWSSYFPWKTINEIGGYDNNFPNGYGVDIDHTYRITLKYQIVFMNYWVDHHMQNERAHDKDPDSQKKMEEASKYFKKKWGID